MPRNAGERLTKVFSHGVSGIRYLCLPRKQMAPYGGHGGWAHPTVLHALASRIGRIGVVLGETAPARLAGGALLGATGVMLGRGLMPKKGKQKPRFRDPNLDPEAHPYGTKPLDMINANPAPIGSGRRAKGGEEHKEPPHGKPSSPTKTRVPVNTSPRAGARLRDAHGRYRSSRTRPDGKRKRNAGFAPPRYSGRSGVQTGYGGTYKKWVPYAQWKKGKGGRGRAPKKYAPKKKAARRTYKPSKPAAKASLKQAYRNTKDAGIRAMMRSMFSGL